MTPRPLHILALLVCAAGWLALRFLDAAPAEATIAPVEAAQTGVQPPQGSREAWARDVLAGLGNVQPSAATVTFMVEWSLAEDAGDGAMARNNLWNTTQPGFHDLGCMNEDCVRTYATYQDGVAATLQTLSYGYYAEVVAGLQTNDPARAKAGLIASPWAASHYNGGVGWPQVGE